MADYWSHLHLLQWRMKYNTGKTPWENGLNVLSVCSKSLCWGPYLGTCAGWTVWQHRFRDLIVWSALLSLQRTILLSLSLVVCMGRRRQKTAKCSLSTSGLLQSTHMCVQSSDRTCGFAIVLDNAVFSGGNWKDFKSFCSYSQKRSLHHCCFPLVSF